MTLKVDHADANSSALKVPENLLENLRRQHQMSGPSARDSGPAALDREAALTIKIARHRRFHLELVHVAVTLVARRKPRVRLIDHALLAVVRKRHSARGELVEKIAR